MWEPIEQEFGETSTYKLKNKVSTKVPMYKAEKFEQNANCENAGSVTRAYTDGTSGASRRTWCAVQPSLAIVIFLRMHKYMLKLDLALSTLELHPALNAIAEAR